MKVPFFKLSFGDEEKSEVQSVLNKGWITTGPKVNELEEYIKKLTGAEYACAVSSGTAGLHLVLETLDLKTDDEVITTPFTMIATVEAIIHAGAKPVLADIIPGTLNINPVMIEKAITSKTKAIIPVDIAGYSCDYDRLQRISSDNNIFLLSDSAHALGAKYKNEPLGSLADATVFSFYPTKNITTGEGGMVVSDSEKLIKKVRHLSLHGMTSSGWKRNQGRGWRYDVTELGYKYNMSDLAAALGVGQMKRFEKRQVKREELAKRYINNLSPLSDYIELPYCNEQNVHSRHLFIIKMIPGKWSIGRDRLIEELENVGVGCGVHYIPIYHFSYFKKLLDYRPTDFPHCEIAFSNVISLPLYPDLTFNELDYVCEKLKSLSIRFLI